ncbi:prepilin-type N-terminal cleavage/methylation domain-containing protein [Pyxidicoccus fallax]|uniref:Prepilin-type N-terminal cleavage/methylation domain-containing protein n=1 Tax=Pyxidicoccus fallax TaxID=394095 RepID=A0A848LG31_9BACT|nr:prepilin-type N-terminal cleavage/methylation domain-containing protein [Pyxidicoccus fallax]NMO16055.1 prepilin-type N-terminal cleavage/methylation domain-containing protein [Pyxidicoccus fallax]NPC84352.1 prepilin-type N-terminal cleavage/methylation domain-containing protein [Pyxidicoccus fallax]
MKRMNTTASRGARGFTLMEVMIASSLSLTLLAGAITAGVYLQRRGILEERTMEVQNAGRAARDLLAPAIQRAGAGFGKARLDVSGNGALLDQRYAIWVTTNAVAADFAGDFSFAPPAGNYAHLISDAVEIWEADSSRMVRLSNRCGAASAWDGDDTVCVDNLPAGTFPDNSLAVIVNVVADQPAVQTACVGMVSGSAPGPNGVVNWRPGLPGRPPPPISDCDDQTPSQYGGGNVMMPLTVRSFRVNWFTRAPVLEMDPDGPGPAPYQAMARDIERIKVRLGVFNPGNPIADVVYFPEQPLRPLGVDECTNATCWALVPTPSMPQGANDFGSGSARDELMRRVRMVELSITARTLQPEAEAVQRGLNGATRDAENNPIDGFKRRHFIQRIAPRNFAISGGAT